jgi:hypothetical protein
MDELLQVNEIEFGDHQMGSRKLSVCLITSLSIVDFIDRDATIEAAKKVTPSNIGVLTLAAILRRRGYEPSVVNLDRLFLKYRQQNECDTQGPTASDGTPPLPLDTGVMPGKHGRPVSSSL